MHEVPTYEKIMILKYYQVDFLVNKQITQTLVGPLMPTPSSNQTGLHLKSRDISCSPFRGSAHKKKKKVPSGSASGMKHEEKEQQLATSDTSLN